MFGKGCKQLLRGRGGVGGGGFKGRGFTSLLMKPQTPRIQISTTSWMSFARPCSLATLKLSQSCTICIPLVSLLWESFHTASLLASNFLSAPSQVSRCFPRQCLTSSCSFHRWGGPHILRRFFLSRHLSARSIVIVSTFTWDSTSSVCVSKSSSLSWFSFVHATHEHCVAVGDHKWPPLSSSRVLWVSCRDPLVGQWAG